MFEKLYSPRFIYTVACAVALAAVGYFVIQQYYGVSPEPVTSVNVSETQPSTDTEKISEISEDKSLRSEQPVEKFAKEEEIIRQAVSLKDPELCMSKLYSLWKERCITKVAVELRNPELCDKIAALFYNDQTREYKMELCRERVRYGGEIPEQSRSYFNEQYGYAVTYPWPTIEYLTAIADDAFPHFRKEGDVTFGGINIRVNLFGKDNENLESFVDNFLNNEIEEKTYYVITLQEKKRLPDISGFEAWQVYLLYTDDTYGSHTLQKNTFILNGDYLYNISLGARLSVANTFLSAYDQMVETFEIEPAPILWQPWPNTKTDLSPGFEFERKITISSNKNIRNGEVILSGNQPGKYPKLYGQPLTSHLVHIEPSTFDLIEAGKKYEIKLRFSIPDDYIIGEDNKYTGDHYSGFLRIKEGDTVFSTALKTELNVKHIFGNMSGEDKLAVDGVSQYWVDAIDIIFKEGISRDEEIDFIESIPAKIIGYYGSSKYRSGGNLYVLGVDASTIQELKEIIENIKALKDPRVYKISKVNKPVWISPSEL